MKKQLAILLQCREFPGIRFGDYLNVHLGVQRGKGIVDVTRGDAGFKEFCLTVDVAAGKDGLPNFSGPFVHGKTGNKFLYLVWFDKKDEANEMFRRAKIKLQHFTWEAINTALENETPVTASVRLTDPKGCPVCASLKPGQISWDA
jgi:hypothetical protein